MLSCKSVTPTGAVKMFTTLYSFTQWPWVSVFWVFSFSACCGLPLFNFLLHHWFIDCSPIFTGWSVGVLHSWFSKASILWDEKSALLIKIDYKIVVSRFKVRIRWPGKSTTQIHPVFLFYKRLMALKWQRIWNIKSLLECRQVLCLLFGRNQHNSVKQLSFN